MNEERINQLQRYLETLVTLKDAGFHCNDEIQMTIYELGKELGIEQSKRVTVTVNGDKYKPVRAAQLAEGEIIKPVRAARYFS